jgi:voltage-gated potassium channel
MESLSEHYIICGFSRTGRQIAQEFQAESVPFMIIELEPESLRTAQQMGYVSLLGDATLDETLLLAGIEKAHCLVAALPKDAENLYTLISAKTLNPEIRVVARGSTMEAMQKLQRAGADVVVSPYITGGKRMAAAALRPQVLNFVEGLLSGSGENLYMEEFQLHPSVCAVSGQRLRELRLRARTGALVVAIRRRDGTLIGGPTADTELMAGDLLICMGTFEQLHQLNQILEPLRSQLPRSSRSIAKF